MVVFENGKQTIESEIPASFSKPGMERMYIGSQRRFVCSRDVINILPNNNTFFVTDTKNISNIGHLDVGLSHLSLCLIFHVCGYKSSSCTWTGGYSTLH